METKELLEKLIENIRSEMKEYQSLQSMEDERETTILYFALLAYQERYY